MRRTLLASALPALVVTVAWLSLEQPRQLRQGFAFAALAIVPALAPRGARRLVALALAALVASWMAFGAQPWELAPFRDERVLAPALRDVARGIVDFYEVLLPFEPSPNPEMHSLVLVAIFGFVLALALFVAARRPLGAAAVTVAGVGWPATLLGGTALAAGTFALAAALAIPLVLRATSIRTVLVGGAIGSLVVVGAVGTSSATTLARDSAIDWETWDIRGPQVQAPNVRFVWDANYDGIQFPPVKTEVLRIEGVERPNYWRVSTLDLYTNDRWFENLLWFGSVSGQTKVVTQSRLLPPRASRPENWIEQRVEVRALVDDRLAAAGTPVAIDAGRLGTVFQLSGGVLRAREPLERGDRYRVWSFAADPSPAALSAAKPIYPAEARRYLELDGRVFPDFGAPERDRLVRELFADPSYGRYARHRPLYDVARRVAGRAPTPYAAVLALESWLRQRGGFVYDETPPRAKGPALVAFLTDTKAGYCQQFAGSMAAMLRTLGIPSRVAVGFTSGVYEDGGWTVTDHNAHAWVEVWFRGQGWVPFDPTPGRGTLAGEYSFASGSADAVARLSRGELTESSAPAIPPRVPDAGDLPSGVGSSTESRAPSLIGVGLLLAALWIVVLGLGKAVVRRVRYFSRDPRRQATASRRELEDFLRDQGADVPSNATLATLQQAVHDELGLDGRAFALAAAQARFGPPDSVARDASGVRREVRRLLRAARGELSLWARLRGLVSLRSLRSARGS